MNAAIPSVPHDASDKLKIKESHLYKEYLSYMNIYYIYASISKSMLLHKLSEKLDTKPCVDNTNRTVKLRAEREISELINYRKDNVRYFGNSKIYTDESMYDVIIECIKNNKSLFLIEFNIFEVIEGKITYPGHATSMIFDSMNEIMTYYNPNVTYEHFIIVKNMENKVNMIPKQFYFEPLYRMINETLYELNLLGLNVNSWYFGMIEYLGKDKTFELPKDFNDPEKMDKIKKILIGLITQLIELIDLDQNINELIINIHNKTGKKFTYTSLLNTMYVCNNMTKIQTVIENDAKKNDLLFKEEPEGYCTMWNLLYYNIAILINEIYSNDRVNTIIDAFINNLIIIKNKEKYDKYKQTIASLLNLSDKLSFDNIHD